MTESRLPAWGYVTVWEFRVRPEAFEVFERIYGPDGDWVRLFQTAEGYVTTELNRDLRQAGRYVTLDFWTSLKRTCALRKHTRASMPLSTRPVSI